MTIKDNCSLLEHNTFGVACRTHHLVEYDSVEELQAFVQQRQLNADASPLLPIGGGSNLLFLSDYEGTILHSRMQDIDVTADEGDFVYVRVAAGVVWDAWVAYALDSNWYGLENLSLIPGEVGAAAVQNIGAYGAEAKDFILFVDAVDLSSGDVCHFTAEECRYGYRDSAFKHEWRGRYAITHVHFRLSHAFRPRLNYSGLRRALEEQGIDELNLTARQLRQLVIDIRRAKLPEPSVLGNAGSFFTNPVVERPTFERLLRDFPTMPYYEADAGRVKISAGWMIEQCGWKGRSLGRAGVYDRQALILVNLGGATGLEIKALCERLQEEVRNKFGVDITPEVCFI